MRKCMYRLIECVIEEIYSPQSPAINCADALRI